MGESFGHFVFVGQFGTRVGQFSKLAPLESLAPGQGFGNRTQSKIATFFWANVSQVGKEEPLEPPQR